MILVPDFIVNTDNRVVIAIGQKCAILLLIQNSHSARRRRCEQPSCAPPRESGIFFPCAGHPRGILRGHHEGLFVKLQAFPERCAGRKAHPVTGTRSSLTTKPRRAVGASHGQLWLRPAPGRGEIADVRCPGTAGLVMICPCPQTETAAPILVQARTRRGGSRSSLM